MARISPFIRFQYAWSRYLQHFTGLAMNEEKFQGRLVASLAGQPEGQKIEIDRLTQFEVDDFYKRYIKTGTPVVLKGAAKDWPCIERWTLDRLTERYGDDQIMVMDTLAYEKKDSTFNVQETTLSEIIESLRVGDTSKYARFNNLLHRHPELVDDIDHELLFRMRNKMASGNTFQVFMGAKGTKTELHAATAHNLFVQVYGTKKWTLYSSKYDPILRPPVNGTPYFHTNFDPLNPDWKSYPAAKYMNYYQFELEAGDILYNPALYWHHVVNLSATIGFGFRWFGLLSSPRLNFSQVLLSLTATNPSMLFVLRNKQNYSKVFKYIHEQKTKSG